MWSEFSGPSKRYLTKYRKLHSVSFEKKKDSKAVITASVFQLLSLLALLSARNLQEIVEAIGRTIDTNYMIYRISNTNTRTQREATLFWILLIFLSLIRHPRDTIMLYDALLTESQPRI